NRTRGNSDVAGIGIASVTHQVAIHNAAATTKMPELSSESDFKNNRARTKSRCPNIKPINRALLYAFLCSSGEGAQVAAFIKSLVLKNLSNDFVLLDSLQRLS